MPTVGEFYDDLRRTLARGQALEKHLEPVSRQALKHLERNNSFHYMEKTFVMLPNPDSNFFDPDLTEIKEIKSLGYLGSDGGAIPIRKIDQRSIGAAATSRPASYWLRGGKLYFDMSFPDSYPIVMQVALYSEWPQVQSETHDLLELGDDLLKYQVMIQLAPTLRREDRMQGWGILRQDALQSVLIADDALRAEDEVWMSYNGGSDGHLFSEASEAIETITGLYQLGNTYQIGGIYEV